MKVRGDQNGSREKKGKGDDSTEAGGRERVRGDVGIGERRERGKKGKRVRGDVEIGERRDWGGK